jgi:DNA-binding beta-propeller fold protein YncE
MTNSHANDPRNLLVHPGGKFLYVIDESSTPAKAGRMAIATNGALSAPGSTAATAGAAGGGVATDANGKFLFTTQRASTPSVAGFVVNTTTGVLTGGTAVASGSSPTAIAVHPSEVYFYVADGDATLQRHGYDATTGAVGAATALTLPASSAASFVAIARRAQ